MDPPLSAAAAAAALAPPPNTLTPDSSPRSRSSESLLDVSSKLRLMCSYGGRIVPRPHDKSLRYVGGDTRIVVVDRLTNLQSLSSRLSSTLLNGRDFTLKYQLPNEDLDSLISVTTDEDLDNMIEEYDRSCSNKSRIRLFLFPSKPDSTQSMVDTSANTHDWFLTALNRGFSDSETVNSLLGLDDESGTGDGVQLAADVAVKKQEVHSVPDSPMLENSSSFGSASSLANLPPIRVHVEDGGGSNRGGGLHEHKVAGIEDQFAQISVGGGVGKDEGLALLSSSPPMPVSIAVPVGGLNVAVGEYANQVVSDDERSDHGVPVGYRKPPPSNISLPQSQTQQRSSGGANIDLRSPDSVSSDSSFGNAMNRPKQQPVIYQEQVMQIPSGSHRIAANHVDPKINLPDPNNQVQIQQQVSESVCMLQPQFDPHHQQQPQQYIHTGGGLYVQHHPTGAVPISYVPVYPPQQQHHQQHHQQLDQQYPVYYVQAPPRQPQPYRMPVQQTSIGEPATNIPTGRPQASPNPTIVPSSTAYNVIRNAPVTKPEMAASGMYRTAAPGGPQLVQVPLSQHQQYYVGYSQIHHQSQPVVPSSAGNANYAYEFADPAHAQMYTQPLAHTIPSQYQTVTAGAASVAMPESSQLPTDNQQMRTSQPI